MGGAHNVKAPKRQFMGRWDVGRVRAGLDAVQGAVLSLSLFLSPTSESFP